MQSLTINTQKASQRFIATVILLFAALLLAFTTGRAQDLRKGVSVQMATTHSATPVPDADNESAWIVTITADGSLYFGAEPMTTDELTDWMKTHPRNREAKLYIKADARAPFISVERALEIGRAAYFGAPVLLTSQTEPVAPGTMVPPKGLEVLVGPAPLGAATLVQLVDLAQQWPQLRVNGDELSWSALDTTLKQHFQKGDEKVVVVKADGAIPFVQVVHAIDVCRSLGAKVAITTPEL